MPVRNLKKGEYGRVLYFNAGEALQSAGPTVEFIRPDGSRVYELAQVGAQDVTGRGIDGQELTYLAGEYAFLAITPGLIDQAGRWTYKLVDSTLQSRALSDCGTFKVVC